MTMQVLHAAEASDLFDSLANEREDGAVTAIHGAWLEHSSSLARSERLEPATPLDMLVLYRAAAATFREAGVGETSLTSGGKVINRDQARARLRSIKDPELAALATRFANQVIELSQSSSVEQDLDYFVALFLHAVSDQRVIDGIRSGAISQSSSRLADPDLW